jgi:hypothetical protein
MLMGLSGGFLLASDSAAQAKQIARKKRGNQPRSLPQSIAAEY